MAASTATVAPTQRGSRAALAAVSLSLFCIQLDFFGLNLAITAHRLGDGGLDARRDVCARDPGPTRADGAAVDEEGLDATVSVGR